MARRGAPAVSQGRYGTGFDTGLQRLRRYGFVRMYGQAHVAGRLYGSARYRLRALDLETGRKLGVASLTDRGIIDLAGVARAAVDRARQAAAGESGGYAGLIFIRTVLPDADERT